MFGRLPTLKFKNAAAILGNEAPGGCAAIPHLMCFVLPTHGGRRGFDFKAVALGDEESSHFIEGGWIRQQLGVTFIVSLRLAAAKTGQCDAGLVLDAAFAKGTR